jgi:hypothetical protein
VVSGIIGRPRLIQRLAAGADQRLTVVVGPPGSGKTTLLAAWSRHLQRHGAWVAWVSLPALPGSPQRFWAAALAACDLALGRTPRCFDDACSAAHLVDTLGDRTRSLVLILDGYETIQDPAIHADLAAILARPELPLRLVIAARGWPPLPLASLRARDALLELHPAELAWSADEAAPLLARTLGRPLSNEELTTLLLASEGWLAGLRLAALALRDHPDRVTVATAADGAQPYLAAYLYAEVVALLSPGLQRALRDAAALGALTVPLFAAATERTPADAGAAMREGLDWFEAHLKGRRETLRALPIRLLVMGTNEWRSLASWPPPSEPRRWHLTPDGTLVEDAPASAGVVQFHFDPADPTPTIGGALLGAGAGMRKQQQLEARSDVRHFVSRALATPMEVIGDVWLTLQVQTSVPWADIAARLCVVGIDGVARNLCDGLCRLAPELAGRQADGGAQLRLRLGPTAYRFQPGERLALQIAGASHALWGRNLGTGEPASTTTRMQAIDYTLSLAPDTPAILELPVVGELSDMPPVVMPGTPANNP